MRRAAEEKMSVLTDLTDSDSKKSSNALKLQLLQDLDVLHNSPSQKLFNVASDLFLEKWRNSANKQMPSYLSYFKNEWLSDSHRGWYASYISGVGTNNGLEATNAVIKKESILRKRLALAFFLKNVCDLANSWSKERNVDHLNYRKPIALQVSLGTAGYREAYQWLKSSTRVTIQSDNIYFSRAGKWPVASLTAADVKAYKTAVAKLHFNSFDDYFKILNGVWCTTLNRLDFRLSTCTCPAFFLKYLCKHIVGIAALEKLIKIPCEAKSVEIGQKPSRGRPAQARKALQHQEPVALVQQPMPQASILPCTSSN